MQYVFIFQYVVCLNNLSAVCNLFSLIILIFLQHYPIQQAPACGVVEILGCQMSLGQGYCCTVASAILGLHFYFII